VSPQSNSVQVLRMHIVVVVVDAVVVVVEVVVVDGRHSAAGHSVQGVASQAE